MLIGFVTIYITCLCLQRLKYGDVPWHALLCTIGFNFLMAEGILTYYKGNSVTHTWFRQEKVILHITLQLLGSILGIAGIIIRMNFDKVHFTTLHGKLGFAAFLLCLVNLILGLSAIFSAKLKNYIYPLFNKSIHGILGLLSYTTAIVSLIYGLNTYVFGRISPPLEINHSSANNVVFILKIATVASLMMTIYGPFITRDRSKTVILSQQQQKKLYPHKICMLKAEAALATSERRNSCVEL
ncbi:transmembrane reductase CYB561D2-like [Eupeodes corollae]|uniref:transmembrane reductase CYB561D2-like n=1 Tax=Eupeodes corollae TaxID=290404 RepID=UPI00248FD9DE|nr:transmembrane reductase CYB561D2-like [Eupeodes corollae]